MTIELIQDLLTETDGNSVVNTQFLIEQPGIKLYTVASGINPELDFWKDTCCGKFQNPAHYLLVGYFPYDLTWSGLPQYSAENKQEYEWAIIRKLIHILFSESLDIASVLDLETITRQYYFSAFGIFSNIFLRSEMTQPDLKAFTQFLENGFNLLLMLPDQIDLPLRYNFYSQTAFGNKILVRKLQEGLDA